jgi:uncharacterized protein YhaN
MLRREVAVGEAAELEELLDKMTREEADAIARAASVRARLRSTEDAIRQMDADLQGGREAAE